MSIKHPDYDKNNGGLRRESASVRLQATPRLPHQTVSWSRIFLRRLLIYRATETLNISKALPSWDEVNENSSNNISILHPLPKCRERIDCDYESKCVMAICDSFNWLGKFAFDATCSELLIALKRKLTYVDKFFSICHHMNDAMTLRHVRQGRKISKTRFEKQKLAAFSNGVTYELHRESPLYVHEKQMYHCRQ